MAATASRTTSPERRRPAGAGGGGRGLLGPVGAAADRGGDLVEGGGGLFQAGGLLLGALGQVVRGAGDLVGAARMPLGFGDGAHRVAQAVDGGVEVFLDRQVAAFELFSVMRAVRSPRGQALQIAGQRADDGALLVLGLAAGLDGRRSSSTCRDVGGELDDLAGLAGGVEDRVVGALDPDVLAALADALELVGEELAAVQAGARTPCTRRCGRRRVDEHAVVAA
jgi:hypothetical protein